MTFWVKNFRGECKALLEARFIYRCESLPGPSLIPGSRNVHALTKTSSIFPRSRPTPAGTPCTVQHKHAGSCLICVAINHLDQWNYYSLRAVTSTREIRTDQVLGAPIISSFAFWVRVLKNFCVCLFVSFHLRGDCCRLRCNYSLMEIFFNIFVMIEEPGGRLFRTTL